MANASSQSDYTDAFDDVHRDELARIATWRRSCEARAKSRNSDLRDDLDTTGLAISGGGIRSAAFALGVLQSIDECLGDGKVTGLRYIDYLSTVSGGGYIGSSMIAGMHADGGKFPFSAGVGDKSDSPAVGHIRNHSRYLLPNGLRDIIGSVVVIFRGLTANLAMVMGVILILAGLTGVFNPDQEAFATPDLLGLEGWPYPPFVCRFGDFAYTKILLLVGMLHMILWAFIRSCLSRNESEFRGPLYGFAYGWIILLALSAFLELQPFAIRSLFAAAGDPPAEAVTPVGFIARVVSTSSPYIATLAAVGALASRILGNAVKAAKIDKSYASLTQAAIAKLAALALMLALPLLIWVVYLHVTIWTDMGYVHRPPWLAELVGQVCGAPDARLAKTTGLAGPPCQQRRLIAVLFVAAGALLTTITWALKPNANSLHRLYRDRLSKAFLFAPVPASLPAAVKLKRCSAELGKLPLADLDAANGPVQLINCALNVQGSQAVNRRGRNADFFFFSSAWSGSNATGFARSTSHRSIVKIPDLGTAMAISGAAASSNMGGYTIAGLAPTLALLNIRLGYWMKNPAALRTGFGDGRSFTKRLRSALKLYMAEEMFGLLDECSDSIYLTDGGHIENLGLYELLRRRCRLIFVVDGEADGTMSFAALVNAQRFARIDLGVRVTLPWQGIGMRPKSDDEGAERPAPSSRSHVAVGTVEYNEGAKGLIVYVKASMTGDENDYISFYQAKNPAFPHETTGDQFFSEEQFEAYRALGFHCLASAFSGKTPIAGWDNLDLVDRLAQSKALGKTATKLDLRAIFKQSIRPA
jgi:hypothetical protein